MADFYTKRIALYGRGEKDYAAKIIGAPGAGVVTMSITRPGEGAESTRTQSFKLTPERARGLGLALIEIADKIG